MRSKTAFSSLFALIVIFIVGCATTEKPEAPEAPEAAAVTQEEVQAVTEPAPEDIEQDLDTSEIESIEEDLDLLIIE